MRTRGSHARILLGVVNMPLVEADIDDVLTVARAIVRETQWGGWRSDIHRRLGFRVLALMGRRKGSYRKSSTNV